MEEIAATFRGAEIPEGFGMAAAEVFRRVPHQVPHGDATDLYTVLRDLTGEEPSRRVAAAPECGP